MPYEAVVEALAIGSALFEAALVSAQTDAAEAQLPRLLAAAQRQLSDLTVAGPVLFVLDDLQWADRGTLAVLAHICRQPFAERIAFLVTYRESDGAGTPLRTTIANVQRECDVERIHLGGLAESEVEGLVAETAGKVVAAQAQSIYQRTDGNPFFVRELARHVVEAGAERLDQGVVPEGVAELVAARVGRLGRPGSEALAVASVVGEEFDLRVVAELLSRGAGSLLDDFERAVADGLVDEVGAGRYRFAHALIREAVYGSLSQSRRLALHRAAAEALCRLHEGDGPHLVEIALHLSDAVNGEGDGESAVEAVERAAAWAHGLHAYEQEVVLHTRALRLLPPADERRKDLTIRRAVAYQRLQHTIIDPLPD